MELIIIGVVAVATSVLSALAGLGGGVILLVVLLQFFAPITAIPIHGGIQLVSNGSRAAFLRENINWRAVGWSSLLLFPASMLGVAVATSMPERTTRLIIGVFVLVVAWRPGLLKWRGADTLPDQAMVGIGAASGFLNTTIGVSGPMTSPFFKAVTASHTAYVATAGASQVVAHLSKVAAFALDDFVIADHIAVIAAGSIGVLAGSWIGTRLLGRVTEQHLNLLFKGVLTVMAIRLIGQSPLD